MGYNNALMVVTVMKMAELKKDACAENQNSLKHITCKVRLDIVLFIVFDCIHFSLPFYCNEYFKQNQRGHRITGCERLYIRQIWAWSFFDFIAPAVRAP